MVEVCSVQVRMSFSHVRQSVHVSQLFSSQLYTHHLWSFKLEHYLCFHANSHIVEFRWLATWLRCVQYMWGWAFHMYIKVYTFHRFLALNSTHIICEASNLNTTFVLMLIIILLSFVDWRRGCMRCILYVWGWAFHMYGKVYTFHSFLALNSTHIICEASNLNTTFVLMLIVIFLSFIDWRRGWGVFCTHEDEFNFHMYGKVYTFHSFLALNSTHIICEASNLNTTFVLMLIVIFLSFVDWRHGWGVFSTCEDELFTCTVHVSQLFSSQLYTHHLWSFKLEHYLCFDANSHNLEFHWLTTWLRCVLYTWGWA